MADSITAEEYGLWWAEYCRSPWGELRQDTGFGIVAATLANVNRGKSVAAFKPTDFMPWHEETADEKAERHGSEDDERDNLFRMMGGT